MTRMLRVEMLRLVSRRAVLVIVGLALVIPLVIGVATTLNSRPPSADAIAEAERQVAAETDSKWVQKDLARCLDKPARYGVDADGDVREACEAQVLPQVEWYLWWNELDLATERDEGSGPAVVILLSILTLLAGTTFAGHDWASGSVSNQLLFEPRRILVWGAKALVVTAGAGLLTFAVVSLYWLGLAQVARARDITLADGVLLDCLQSGWRGAGVAAGAALAGYALTMLFRSTVAALGVLLAVSVAGGIVLAVIGIGSIWNPGLNVAAIILDGTTYWAQGPCPGGQPPGDVCEVQRTLHLDRALTFLGTSLVLFAGASLATFHRRDVA